MIERPIPSRRELDCEVERLRLERSEITPEEAREFCVLLKVRIEALEKREVNQLGYSRE
jgi:hypothetical protein